MNVNENSEGDGNMLYRIACCDDEQQILDRLKECFVRLEVQTDIETQVDYYTDGRNLIQAYQADHSKYFIRHGDATYFRNAGGRTDAPDQP